MPLQSGKLGGKELDSESEISAPMGELEHRSSSVTGLGGRAPK
jgi:hypothetical protein